MLIDHRIIDKVADILPKEAFYHLAHQLVSDAIYSLANQTLPVDQLTVAAELRKRDQIDQVGGVVYLAKLAAGVASAANAVYHARMVKEAWIKRRIIELSMGATSKAYDASSESLALIDGITAALLDLQSTREDEGPVHIEQVADSAFAEIERRREKKDADPGIITGFRDQDEAIISLEPADYMLIAGRPSHGKTALMLNMAATNLDRGKGVMIFSLEMAKRLLFLRLLSSKSEVGMSDIRRGLLSEEDFLAMAKATGKMIDWKLWIDDSPGLTPPTIERRVRDYQRRNRVDLVMIDYIQLLSAGEKQFRSREQEVSYYSRSMKGMAKNCNVPLVALSQMSRAVESRPDHRPQLSDLRDTGSLEQDADLVIFCDYPEQRGITEVTMTDGSIRNVTGMAELILAKQRNGPLASSWVIFEKAISRFVDVASSTGDQRIYFSPNNE